RGNQQADRQGRAARLHAGAPESALQKRAHQARFCPGTRQEAVRQARYGPRKRLAARKRAHHEARHAQQVSLPPKRVALRSLFQEALPVFTMAMADAIRPPTSDRFDGRISVLPSLATLPKAST